MPNNVKGSVTRSFIVWLLSTRANFSTFQVSNITDVSDGYKHLMHGYVSFGVPVYNFFFNCT